MTSASEQYREFVQHYVRQGRNLSDIQQILEQQRSYLKLLSQEAEAIERSVLQTDSQTVSPINSQTNSQSNSQLNSQSNSQVSLPTEPQTDSSANSPSDSQTYSQSNPPSDSQSNLPSNSQIDLDTHSQPDSQLDSQLNSQLNSQPDSPTDLETHSQSSQQSNPNAVPAIEQVVDQPSNPDQPVALVSENLSAPALDPHTSKTRTTNELQLDEPQPKPIAPETPPNPEAISRYQAAFAQAIRLQSPLEEVLKLGLRSLQQNLNLSDERVEAIQARAYEELDAEKQQYEANLEKYREEFKGSRAFLYSESTQNELFDLQHKLGLRGEDVLRIERAVLRDAKRETQYDPSPLDSSLFASPEIQALADAIQAELFQPSDATDRKGVPLQGSASHPSPETLVPEITDSHVADAQIAAAFQQRSQDPAQNQAQDHAQNQTQNQAQGETVPNLKGKPDPQTKPGSQNPPTTPLHPELEEALQELEKHLSPDYRDWWKADQTTFEILLMLTPDQSLTWLNMDAIEKITQFDVLERIDRLWSAASQGRFGLFAQQEVYKKVVKDLEDEYKGKMKGERLQELYVQEFARRVGWAEGRLQFIKFYQWLDFQTDLVSRPDIPSGQFPAYWFWAIPRKYGLRLGGFGFGKGGWRIDVPRLHTWLVKIRKCKLEPYEKNASPPPPKTKVESPSQKLRDPRS